MTVATRERWWSRDQALVTGCLICLIVSICALTVGAIALNKSVNTASQRAADLASSRAIAESNDALRASQCASWRFQAGAVQLPNGKAQPDPVTALGWSNRVYAKDQYDDLGCLPHVPAVEVPKQFQ
ncbi:hypothetical protein [Kineosporia succinea]|uniref:Flp pilus-assembly TadE/G-like protein n=1 Tax=Kineosporia succinea TaxID=84632 RepID=A0ABT9NXT5_9ACTN|nr:hypothetical protein [Kineosporia succinea]MDP9825248.1 hypothetical protein [Kineosporia succinea]